MTTIGYAQKKPKKTTPQSALASKMPVTRGDRNKAIKVKRYEYTGREYIVQLGYIDTFFTTVEHFRDNAELGLVVLPAEKNCKVVSFEVDMLPARGDMMGPSHVDGDTLYGRPYQVRQMLEWIKPGYKISFHEIKVKCPTRDIRFSVKDVIVRIVTDSAYEEMLPQMR